MAKYKQTLQPRFGKGSKIFLAIAIPSMLVTGYLLYDASRLLWIIFWITIGGIALVSLGVALDSRVVPLKRYPKKLGLASWELMSLHERANHEDILHTRRLMLFLTFNAFLGIAVIVSGRFPAIFAIIFSVVGFFVGLLWLLWSANATVNIRVLRDAGGKRIDEKLWDGYIRELDEKLGPLDIFNTVIPILLCLAWLFIGLYYGYLVIFEP